MVRRPMRRAVRNTRQAISPRLATRTDLNIRLSEVASGEWRVTRRHAGSCDEREDAQWRDPSASQPRHYSLATRHSLRPARRALVEEGADAFLALGRDAGASDAPGGLFHQAAVDGFAGHVVHQTLGLAHGAGGAG